MPKKQRPKGAVFVIPLPESGKFGYGVITNNTDDIFFVNVYNFTSDRDDNFENAAKSDVLIKDLFIGGDLAFSKQGYSKGKKHLVWRVSKYIDSSEKSKTHVPCLLVGGPYIGASRAQKVDLITGQAEYVSFEEYEELYKKGAVFSAMNFPEGDSIMIEEFLLKFRKHPYGQNLRYMTLEERHEIFEMMKDRYSPYEAEQFKLMWLQDQDGN